MRMVRVVALCGRRGAGKDALADAMSSRMAFVNLKFARPMKDALALLFGFGSEDLDGQFKDVVHQTWGVSPRTMMQWFGTDVMQHGLKSISPKVGRGFWAEKLIHEAHRVLEDPRNLIVISDMRFEHELCALEREFGDALVTVRVERADPERISQDEHESESTSAHLDVDIVVRNDGTLSDLDAVGRSLLFGKTYRNINTNMLAVLVTARSGVVYFSPIATNENNITQFDTCAASEWLLTWKWHVESHN